MSEAIYKVGDVLKFDGRGIVPMEFWSAKPPFNILILRVVHPGPEFYIYTVVYEDPATAAMKVVAVNQKDLLWSAKRIGHINLDPFLDENWKEPEKIESEKCPGCEALKKKDKSDLDDWMLMTSVAMALGSSKKAKELEEENEKLRKERDEQKDAMIKAIDKLYEHGFRYSVIADILGLEDGVIASARIEGTDKIG